MDTAEISKSEIDSAPPPQDVEMSWDDEVQQLVQNLPKEEAWISGSNLYLYQGFWSLDLSLKPVISLQRHFQASDSDIIIATFPKCGTTWLKALAFSTLYRNQFAWHQNPLLTSTPHQLVRFLEYDLYLNNPCPDLETLCVYKPRAFATHVPFASLPTSIKVSQCKVVYLCRNPMDMFTSSWHFNDTLRHGSQELLSLDEAFDKFCHGISLKYLAMVLGVPFTEDEDKQGEDEDKQGVVEEIAKICEFEKLRELEVNKNGSHISGAPHKAFFRKGKVGDWSNYLTPSMVERMEKLIQQKLDGSADPMDITVTLQRFDFRTHSGRYSTLIAPIVDDKIQVTGYR
ncbi:RNA-directed DNA polymerase (Reverse transcriptase), Ribonuclease H [Hibiscus syriacus]|uniref:Sulfotransferase n=1 Tax=Hibiscus syriacus TaxID=106335 RepID=A0A6A3BDN7_HIBSY|nr:RNA-directed DNA polymerase (Reverse transcriptase), Ribonuclease H [Hibiscus syriacus]